MNDTDEGIFSCRNVCWIVGALLGLVAFLLISGFWGLIVGIVLAVVVALALLRLFCAGAGELAATHAQPAAEAPAAPVPAPAPEPAPVPAPAPEPEAKPLAGVARDDAEAALAEESTEATPDYDGDGVKEGTGEGKRPEALSAARGGQADDLKMIKGVGPKLEQLLNELGFYHFDQIANWTADEVAWVDANLKGFKGRVSRDNWVEQAKTLASGAETEFSKRASKSGMYEE